MAANELDFTDEDRARVEAMAAIWTDVMSMGDKSTALAAVKAARNGDVANLVTTRRSPNDRFWTLMTSLGWAEPAADALEEVPEDLPNRDLVVAHRLSEAGVTMLPKFLAAMCRV